MEKRIAEGCLVASKKRLLYDTLDTRSSTRRVMVPSGFAHPIETKRNVDPLPSVRCKGPRFVHWTVCRIFDDCFSLFYPICFTSLLYLLFARVFSLNLANGSRIRSNLPGRAEARPTPKTYISTARSAALKDACI